MTWYDLCTLPQGLQRWFSPLTSGTARLCVETLIKTSFPLAIFYLCLLLVFVVTPPRAARGWVCRETRQFHHHCFDTSNALQPKVKVSWERGVKGGEAQQSRHAVTRCCNTVCFASGGRLSSLLSPEIKSECERHLCKYMRDAFVSLANVFTIVTV